MKMTIKKKQNYEYDIQCRFFVYRYHEVTSDCNLEVSSEKIKWKTTYSSKFYGRYMKENADIATNEIKNITTKKAYAYNLWATIITGILLLMYLMADILIMSLSQGDPQWLKTGVAMFFIGCAVSLLWYQIHSIDVLEIKTKDNKIFRTPFSSKKPKENEESMIYQEIINKLEIK